ncbi:hypothetical protein GCM10023350_43250 [Nocardioides endophyticus]|uniref:Uncharacterized protein n=1 Tax=Nocardioides endophyticus TaxID=1353775 RepID=A0ABP8ZE79_9ACTN
MLGVWPYVGDEEAWHAVTFEHKGLTWYATGDHGLFDEDGCLHIVDRSRATAIPAAEELLRAGFSRGSVVSLGPWSLDSGA